MHYANIYFPTSTLYNLSHKRLEGELARGCFLCGEGLGRGAAGSGLVEAEAAGPIVVVVLPLAVVRPQAERLQLVLRIARAKDLCGKKEIKFIDRV